MATLLKEGLHPHASDALREIGVTVERVGQTIGGAPASAGVHLREMGAKQPARLVDGKPYSAAVDLRIGGLTRGQIKTLLQRLGEVGFAAWYRNPGEDHWPEEEVRHLHAVYAGTKMKLALRNQVRDYLVGRNGLASHAEYEFFQASEEIKDKVTELFLLRNTLEEESLNRGEESEEIMHTHDPEPTEAEWEHTPPFEDAESDDPLLRLPEYDEPYSAAQAEDEGGLSVEYVRDEFSEIPPLTSRPVMPKKETGDRVEPSSAASYAFCSLPEVRERQFGADIHPERLELLLVLSKKWVNGTTLRYYFFDRATDGKDVTFTDGHTEWRPYTTTDAEKNVVRKAFDVWKKVGIGVKFEEVKAREQADIRIGFMRGDGAWSFIGRDIIDLNLSRDDRTMNFGWDLTRRARELDTAVHEIGHTLGFPHEHQNPNAGIVWDEAAVYASLAQPPNQWNRQTTFYNIIRKIEPDSVQGSSWDPDSIMHYPFGAGMIKQPIQYKNGLTPAGGLSARDVTWVKTFYPPLQEADNTGLKLRQSVTLQLAPGQQQNFTFTPMESRDYEVRTFGASDTVMVLFEDAGGKLNYVDGDDDSGEDRNAYLKVKLTAGRKYVLRIRLYYADRAGDTSLMLW